MKENIYRGRTVKGKWIFGSLVLTTNYIKHMKNQHTKTWIVESSFGNGGWFNVQKRSYVKPETVGQFSGLLDSRKIKIFAGDNVYIAGYGVCTMEFPFIELYEAYPEGDIGAIVGNIFNEGIK